MFIVMSKILKTLVKERNIVVAVVCLHETQLILNSSIVLTMHEFIITQMIKVMLQGLAKPEYYLNYLGTC